MIVLDKTHVYGWETAIRGMRNPMNSWDKSDSKFIKAYLGLNNKAVLVNSKVREIGENDLKLMKNLSKAGNDHAKFLRMINVTVDITAPLYWWKEFDTYKVGTVANSCSTMHKIHAKEFELDDFSHEHLDEFSISRLTELIVYMNSMRDMYNLDRNKHYWYQMIQLLPTSYNQKRTVQLNYQVLKSMYFARKSHKLDEWRELCKWTLTLPYFKEVCVDVVDTTN